MVSRRRMIYSTSVAYVIAPTFANQSQIYAPHHTLMLIRSADRTTNEKEHANDTEKRREVEKISTTSFFYIHPSMHESLRIECLRNLVAYHRMGSMGPVFLFISIDENHAQTQTRLASFKYMPKVCRNENFTKKNIEFYEVAHRNHVPLPFRFQ